MFVYGVIALALIAIGIALAIEDSKKKCCKNGAEIYCDIECNESDK